MTQRPQPPPAAPPSQPPRARSAPRGRPGALASALRRAQALERSRTGADVGAGTAVAASHEHVRHWLQMAKLAGVRPSSPVRTSPRRHSGHEARPRTAPMARARGAREARAEEARVHVTQGPGAGALGFATLVDGGGAGGGHSTLRGEGGGEHVAVTRGAGAAREATFLGALRRHSGAVWRSMATQQMPAHAAPVPAAAAPRTAATLQRRAPRASRPASAHPAARVRPETAHVPRQPPLQPLNEQQQRRSTGRPATAAAHEGRHLSPSGASLLPAPGPASAADGDSATLSSDSDSAGDSPSHAARRALAVHTQPASLARSEFMRAMGSTNRTLSFIYRAIPPMSPAHRRARDAAEGAEVEAGKAAGASQQRASEWGACRVRPSVCQCAHLHD